MKEIEKLNKNATLYDLQQRMNAIHKQYKKPVIFDGDSLTISIED